MHPAIDIQLETVRAAFVDGASLDARRAGATACRTLAAILDAQPGQPLAASPPSTAHALASLLPQLGDANIDQLLELAIAKLTAKLPPGTTVPAPRSYPIPALKIGGRS
jgi:hypothetical protein